MNFLDFSAFAFAGSLPVVILFYLLKRKRVTAVVPSTILWQKYLAETQASSPFQKLRHNWLLLLQLLMLILAILALTRPYFAAKAKSGRILVTILDASASMQSTDETPNRFEKARQLALNLVGSMHPEDQMIVLLAGGVTEVRQSPTGEKAALRRAIESARPSDSPTRLKEALKLAQTLIQNSTHAEIHLFSDGATDALTEFENADLPLVYHRVGTRGANVGIVNLDVRSNPEDPRQRAIFATVQNASTNSQEVRAELLFQEEVVDLKVLSLKPKDTSPLVFVASQTHDGVFTLKLHVEDDLSVDNQASVTSLLPQNTKVLLVTPGNRFLEKALKAIPSVEFASTSQLTDNAEGFDVVVLDTVLPVEQPNANILAIRVANTNWFPGWKPLEAPPIVDWRSAHPLLRFVNFDNVQVAEALAVQTPTWAISLVESPSSPLVLAGELKGQKIVWVGFDTLQSTWPLRISFPIFIANAIDWLNPATEKAAQLTVKAGDPFRLVFPESVPEAEITLPDGSTVSRALDQTRRELLFGDTHEQGVYRVKAGTNQVTFCVNLLDNAETETAPRPEIQLGTFTRVSSSTTRQASLEIWRWFALSALLILMFEWWYYHRRTA